MIFLSVGTQLAFDRLIQTVDDWSSTQAHDVFAQVGPSTLVPRNMEYKDFIAPSEVAELCKKADLLVAHAGMGSILTALKYQTPIIVLPRKASLGEHRNEHQLATARWVEKLPGVFVAWDEAELVALLDRSSELTSGHVIEPDAEDRLIQYIKGFIEKA